ncbi:MAG: radical SAM protein [Odoribacteraceae bacterium]|jgi:organic radical activating enzyme|nr:radical SAM protein [Odoribacteraceae bacterium]
MTFDAEQISELFRSDDWYFRQIAAKTLVDEFDAHAHLFFDLLSTTASEELTRHARGRFPSLAGGFAEAGVFVPSRRYAYFSKYAEEHALFLEKLQAYLRRETRAVRRRQLAANLFNHFEGLRDDLSRLFPRPRDPGDARNEAGRQLMIFITGKCNLHCPYCFSGEIQPSEMSLADLEEILRWASRNQVARVSLCGGEPTSHARFDEILSSIAGQGFKTYFASNFTVDCTGFKNFNAGVIEKIYVHVADQTLDNPRLMTRLLTNVERAREEGIALTCRTNIADPNPPVAKWFQFMQQTAIQALNIALTFPAAGANNKHVDLDSFQRYRPVIEAIIDASRERRVDLSFAKPVPPCIFGEQTSRYLLASGNFNPLCAVNEHHCTRNLCVNAQKEFHACLGVTSSSLKFRAGMEWEEVERFCTSVIRPLLTKPLWDKCAACFLFDRKLCQGACLSYKTVS